MRRSDCDASVQTSIMPVGNLHSAEGRSSSVGDNDFSVEGPRLALLSLATTAMGAVESARNSDMALLSHVEQTTRTCLTRVLIAKWLLLDEEEMGRATLLERESTTATHMFEAVMWPTRKALGTIRAEEREFNEETKDVNSRLRRLGC